MAKSTETTASEPVRVFEHGQRPVFILTQPDNWEEREVREKLENPFSYLARTPVIKNEIKPHRLPTEAVLYVVHTYKARRKGQDGRFAVVRDLHISAPIYIDQVSKVDHEGLRAGSFAEDLSQAITKACLPNPADKVLRGQISSIDEKRPLDLLIKLASS